MINIDIINLIICIANVFIILLYVIHMDDDNGVFSILFYYLSTLNNGKKYNGQLNRNNCFITLIQLYS